MQMSDPLLKGTQEADLAMAATNAGIKSAIDFSQEFKPKGDGAMAGAVKDKALLNKDTGGIDFQPDKMNMKTQNNSGEIKFHIDRAMLQQLQNAPGFKPVVISIQPLTDLPLFLGIGTS